MSGQQCEVPEFAPPFQMPNLGAMAEAMLGDAEEARQQAQEAADWREAVLARLDAQTALMERMTGAVERLAAKAESFGVAGAFGSLLGQRRQ